MVVGAWYQKFLDSIEPKPPKKVYVFSEEQKKIRNERAKLWNKTHPDRFKANLRAWQLANKEKIAAKASRYYRKNKASLNANVRAFYLRNPWYKNYQLAKQRCNNPKNPRFSSYGGQEIKFALSKQDVKLLWDRDKANDMLCPTIDRINTYGNYELNNCRFVEKSFNSSRPRRLRISKLMRYVGVSRDKEQIELLKSYIQHLNLNVV